MENDKLIQTLNKTITILRGENSDLKVKVEFQKKRIKEADELIEQIATSLLYAKIISVSLLALLILQYFLL
jgi:hypothetical protein